MRKIDAEISNTAVVHDEMIFVRSLRFSNLTEVKIVKIMSVIPNGIAERYSLNPISLPELKFQNGKNMTVLKKKIQIAFVLEKFFFRKAYMQSQIVHPHDKRQTAVISQVPKESCLVIDLFVNSSDGIATDDLNLGN